MRNLAIFVAFAWFWLLFYSVGPLTTPTEIAAALSTLVAGCLAFALSGLYIARRRRALRRVGPAAAHEGVAGGRSDR